MARIDAEALKAALDDAEARRVDLVDRISSAEMALDDVELECRGLRLAVAQHGVSEPDANPVASMNRTDAILAILSAQAEPVSNRELVALLTESGRDDVYEAASAALAHLSRTDRAHAVTRGQWVIGPPELDNISEAAPAYDPSEEPF